MSQVRLKLQLVMGAIIISFSPILVKIAFTQYIYPTSIAFYRTLVGGVVLLSIAAATGRSLRMPFRTICYAFLAGLFFFVDLSVWHRSILYTGAGLATILGNTQVFSTAIVSRFVFGEKLNLSVVLGAMAAFGGIGLLVGIGNQDLMVTEKYHLGVVLGLLTGLMYSGYLISLKKGTACASSPDVIVFLAWTSLFSAVFLGVGAFVGGESLLPTDTNVILSIVALGVFVQAIAWLGITQTLPHIQTAQAGLILLLQPALATIWGVLFFKEHLEPIQMFGALVALVGMYFGGLRRIVR